MPGPQPGTPASFVSGILAKVASVVGFLNTIPFSVFNATPSTRAEGEAGPFQSDTDGTLWVTLKKALAGEDTTNGVFKVEHQYNYAICTGDTQVKASGGFLHALIIQQGDAVPTAGSIIGYNSLTESGDKVVTVTVSATSELGIDGARTIIVDALMPIGIYIGFTTTADVTVTAIWR